MARLKINEAVRQKGELRDKIERALDEMAVRYEVTPDEWRMRVARAPGSYRVTVQHLTGQGMREAQARSALSTYTHDFRLEHGIDMHKGAAVAGEGRLACLNVRVVGPVDDWWSKLTPTERGRIVADAHARRTA